MDYADTYPYTYNRHYASNIVLHIGTNAACLVLLQVQIRILGYYYFGLPNDKLNDPLHVGCKTLRHVVASSA